MRRASPADARVISCELTQQPLRLAELLVPLDDRMIFKNLHQCRRFIRFEGKTQMLQD